MGQRMATPGGSRGVKSPPVSRTAPCTTQNPPSSRSDARSTATPAWRCEVDGALAQTGEKSGLLAVPLAWTYGQAQRTGFHRRHVVRVVALERGLQDVERGLLIADLLFVDLRDTVQDGDLFLDVGA